MPKQTNGPRALVDAMREAFGPANLTKSEQLGADIQAWRRWPEYRARIVAGGARLTYLDGVERKPIPKDLMPILEIPGVQDLRASTLAYRIGSRSERDGEWRSLYGTSYIPGRDVGTRARWRTITDWHRFPYVKIEARRNGSSDRTSSRKEALAWFLTEVERWKDTKPPGGKAAMFLRGKAEMNGLTREMFRQLWNQYAPPEWKTSGAPKRAPVPIESGRE